jgi:hypothetical protein
MYCVTNGLAQVLRTDISCCISKISSSLDSKSICTESAICLVPRREDTNMLDGDDLSSLLVNCFVSDSFTVSILS